MNVVIFSSHHVEWDVKNIGPYDVIVLLGSVDVTTALGQEVPIVLLQGSQAPKWTSTPLRER